MVFLDFIDWELSIGFGLMLVGMMLGTGLLEWFKKDKKE